jgi:hypothetical protein
LLVDVLKQGRLRIYQSRELRDAAAKTVVHESGRGFRLGKAKGSDRVDPIIALAMAVLMAGREESVGGRVAVSISGAARAGAYRRRHRRYDGLAARAAATARL